MTKEDLAEKREIMLLEIMLKIQQKELKRKLTIEVKRQLIKGGFYG